MLNGILLIDKPRGVTSHDVVLHVRKLLHQKKIGHCGTLDPNATGLLILTLGKATRLSRFFIEAPKLYKGQLILGIETDTYDIEGKIISRSDVDRIEREDIIKAFAKFKGEYLQTPPPYSAKKFKGKRLYHLAREGKEIQLPPKKVFIYDLSIISIDLPKINFSLHCSSGTYARSIVHDLGKKLKVGATLNDLRRIKIGSFDVTNALKIEELEEIVAKGETLGKSFIEFDAIELPFPSTITESYQEWRITHGQNIIAKVSNDVSSGSWIKLTDSRNKLKAVGVVIEKVGKTNMAVIHPKIVFK